jgi:diguanylate cyclase (GGDEF)-like protein/PAS domain S-box-containing protein
VSWVRGLPPAVRHLLLFALAGLAVTVPFSAPDGTGMQWDDLVLGAVAAGTVGIASARLRGMERTAARPWYPLVAGGALFGVTQLLSGVFPGPALDGYGADDVVLFVAASSPLVTGVLLARRVPRTRWHALVVDGAVVTVSLLVVTELLRGVLVEPLDGADGRRTLVLAYGAYAAVMLGMAGALCTVSTVALRRSVSTLMAAVALLAGAASFEALAIVWPHQLWTAAGDLAVTVSLLATALAAVRAPSGLGSRDVRSTRPVASAWGLALVAGAMLTLPVGIVVSRLGHGHHSVTADIGFAVVIGLMALRLVLRIRADGQVTEDLVRSEEDFRDLVESSSDGIAIVDDELRLLFASPAARRLLGLDDSGGTGPSLLDLLPVEDRAPVRAALRRPGAGELVLRVAGAEGGARELDARSAERPGSGRRVLYLRDVTDRRRRERELERMAYTDHLTALPNRARLFAALAQPSAALRSLLVLDMDGFKAVNDVAGHEAGDQLLVEVARRLRTVVREGDVVARLGGDEFAVLVTGTRAEAEEVAQRVVDVLGLPYRTGEWAFAVGASVGVAALGVAGGQVAFREADAALRAAKQAGKGCVRIAHVDVSAEPHDDTDLRLALTEGLVQVLFSTCCRPDGGIELVHAVPVWHHPARGVVRGRELWSTAERQGAAHLLQDWLLRIACAEVATLRDDSVGLVVSLPAGPVTSDDVADQVAGALAASGLAPERLVLSMTEETLLTSSARLVPDLVAARETGVRLCMDEYGMGQSLFALLARIPLDVVRVDVPALAGPDDLDRARHVLTAIVHTAGGFDVTTVAGGVADAELLGIAGRAGVTLVHGRYLPHDLPIDALAGLLAPDATPVPTP